RSPAGVNVVGLWGGCHLVVPGERSETRDPYSAAEMRRHGVWVPAFAGTTAERLAHQHRLRVGHRAVEPARDPFDPLGGRVERADNGFGGLPCAFGGDGARLLQRSDLAFEPLHPRVRVGHL